MAVPPSGHPPYKAHWGRTLVSGSAARVNEHAWRKTCPCLYPSGVARPPPFAPRPPPAQVAGPGDACSERCQQNTPFEAIKKQKRKKAPSDAVSLARALTPVGPTTTLGRRHYREARIAPLCPRAHAAHFRSHLSPRGCALALGMLRRRLTTMCGANIVLGRALPTLRVRSFMHRPRHPPGRRGPPDRCDALACPAVVPQYCCRSVRRFVSRSPGAPAGR